MTVVLVCKMFSRLNCLHLYPADSQCHGEHLAGPTSHEDPVHADVLLQELPQHREDQQLHQLPELLPPEGARHFIKNTAVTGSDTSPQESLRLCLSCPCFSWQTMPVAMALLRDIQNLCPKEVLNFILDLIKYNDNRKNKVEA